jgi:hypothetical protein
MAFRGNLSVFLRDIRARRIENAEISICLSWDLNEGNDTIDIMNDIISHNAGSLWSGLVVLLCSVMSAWNLLPLSFAQKHSKATWTLQIGGSGYSQNELQT